MTESSSPSTRRVAPAARRTVLLGTALAMVLGGALVGSGALPTHQAYAEAVTIDQPNQLPSFANIVDKVSPAVVGIRVRSEASPKQMGMVGPNGRQFEVPDGSPLERFFREFQDNPDIQRQMRRPTISLGSGFFISEDGYVVTNNHVVDGANEFTVIMNDGTEYPAKLIGKDDKTDLALIKVDGDHTFTYVKFAEGDVRVGDWVVAVGNPFGLGGTVTAGIVSGRGRQIGEGPYDDFLQIDAAVNRGNSGGPAFNLQGEVVGVNTAIFSPTGGNVGIAFAIPSSTAESVIASLKDHGSVVRGWLGVQIQSITPDLANGLALNEAHGALVSDPQPGSPAEKAGLRSGDAITAVDGKPVNDARDLAVKIAGYQPNTEVKLTLWRDGKQTELPVTLGTMPGTEQQAALEQPGADALPSAFEGFGMQVSPSDQGVVITSIDPDGTAAENGLQEGDVIVAVGTIQVNSPAEVEAAVAKARENGLKAVLLRVRSAQDDQTHFVALPFAA